MIQVKDQKPFGMSPFSALVSLDSRPHWAPSSFTTHHCHLIRLYFLILNLELAPMYPTDTQLHQDPANLLSSNQRAPTGLERDEAYRNAVTPLPPSQLWPQLRSEHRFWGDPLHGAGLRVQEQANRLVVQQAYQGWRLQVMGRRKTRRKKKKRRRWRKKKRR